MSRSLDDENLRDMIQHLKSIEVRQAPTFEDVLRRSPPAAGPQGSWRLGWAAAIILAMCSKGRQRPGGFDSRRFAGSTERRLVIGFFVLLYAVGAGLIWLIYGRGAALLGMLCMTAGLLLFLLLYGIVWLLGRWAGE